tara:strand:+ start:2504 stop:3817 length:1314 start_codon:yes stop_codon:yes gene_type:complete
MEITKKIFCFLLLLVPVFLITGPAIPDIVITCSGIFFLILILTKKYQFKKLDLSWFKISIIFWIFLIISSFFAQNFVKSFAESVIFIRLLLIPAVLLILLFEYQIAIKLLFVSIFASVIFVISDCLYQFFNYDSKTGFGEDFFGYIPDNSPHFRLTGPFKDLVPGSYVSRFAFFGIVAIYLFIKNKNLKNFLIITYLGLSGFITYISGERMAFATFGLGLIIFILFSKNIYYLLSIVILFLLILISNKFHPAFDYKIVNSTPIHNGLVLEKQIECINETNLNCTILVKSQPKFIEVLKNFNKSAYGEIYLLALNMYKENLIFGIGLNNYNELCATTEYRLQLKNIDCVTHPHNFYLQWLIETGPICLLLFIFYLYSIFISIGKNQSGKIKLLSIITMIILFWPIMSTGSLTKNWYGVSTFYIIGICISIYKMKFVNN